MKISDLKGKVRLVSRPTSRAITPSTGLPGLPGFAVGATKGAASTGLGIGGIGQKIQRGIGSLIDMIPGVNVSGAAKGEESIFNANSEAGKRAQDAVKPQGTAENIGFGVEQFAEYFIPAAKAAKAERAIHTLSKGIANPKLAAMSRVVGKGAVQGLAAGGVQAAQSGGDVKKTAQTAATAGLIRGGFATIGEGARALRIPERLYSTIFKNTNREMLAELKENGLRSLQQRNPQQYKQWVDKGIIKVGEDGAPVLNETLAERALDKGLRGSIRTMADTVVEKTIQSEDEVRNVLKNTKSTVNLSEPQFYKVLKSIADEYEDVGFGEISDEAKRLAEAVKSQGANTNAEIALDVRRLLDKARIARSFDAPASKLSLSQANLKTLADAARQRLNAVENIGAIMKNYSFYIDALEALAAEAKRRGNNQVLGLIDSVFLGGGIASNMAPQGAIMALVAKYLRSGQGTTELAQLLNKGTASPATSAAIGASSGLTTRLTTPQ